MEEIIEVLSSWRTCDPDALALAAPAARRFLRGSLAGLVTVGEHNDLADISREVEPEQTRRGQCRPSRPSGRLHCGETRFKAFAHHEFRVNRRKPYRSTTARSQHQSRWFNAGFAG